MRRGSVDRKIGYHHSFDTQNYLDIVSYHCVCSCATALSFYCLASRGKVIRCTSLRHIITICSGFLTNSLSVQSAGVNITGPPVACESVEFFCGTMEQCLAALSERPHDDTMDHHHTVPHGHHHHQRGSAMVLTISHQPIINETYHQFRGCMWKAPSLLLVSLC